MKEAGNASRRQVRLSLIEFLLLAILVVAPWPLGMVQPEAEHWLLVSIALLGLFWVIRVWFIGQQNIAICPVFICLAAMIAIGSLQVAPLGRDVISGIAPGTAKLYSELLPDEPEVLLYQLVEPLPTASGTTLSLYPNATRRTLLRLLSIGLLFFIVRNGIASTSGAQRLCIVMFVSGVLVGCFALVQFLTSAPRMLFWTLETNGRMHGTFVNSNHFAMYMNTCLGAGLGLMLSRVMAGVGHSKSRRRRKSNLANDPALPWLGLGCGILMVSSLFTLSRGGFAAMLIAFAFSLIVIISRRQRLGRALLLIAPISIALLIATMLGWDDLVRRLGTMFEENQVEVARLTMWMRSWEYIRQFPVFGTGMGTFMFVEPMHLHRAEDANGLYIHAHNEYLQTLIEGGLLWLIVTLFTGFLVIRNCFLICRKGERSTHMGIGIGLLFAVTTIVIHAALDFGLHIPALAVIATVLAAYTSKLAENRFRHQETRTHLRLGLAGRLLASAAIGCLGLIIYGESSRYAFADTVSSAARKLQSQGSLRAQQRRIDLLEEAARRASTDAEVHSALSQAYLDFFNLELNSDTPTDFQALSLRYVLPAMQHAVAARDACPVLPLPHVKIASHSAAFSHADMPQHYLQRVKSLCPVDAKLWYLCGQEELSFDPEEAWKSWQTSLALSLESLRPILMSAQEFLESDEILERVLPGHPPAIIEAAGRLNLEPETRFEYLLRAINLYEGGSTDYSASEYHLIALAYYELEFFEKAEQTYRKALSRQPLNATWRYELACLFYNDGKLQDARRELRLLLGRNPSHSPSSSLMQSINLELAVTESKRDSDSDSP